MQRIGQGFLNASVALANSLVALVTGKDPETGRTLSDKEYAEIAGGLLGSIVGMIVLQYAIKAVGGYISSVASGSRCGWIFRRACFAAGTPMLTPDGSKAIEDFQVGDLILSRDEHRPDGPVEAKTVEEVFVNVAPILRVHVREQVIRTTPEHPFFVQRLYKFVAAKKLQPGDLFLSDDGRWVEVAAIEETDEQETVYNLRVADYHTYFVGKPEWGFSVWAHNICDAKALARAIRQATEMRNAGVPGARRLLRQLKSDKYSPSQKGGYIFQTRRAYAYFRNGQLRAIESKIANGGRPDIILKDGTRIDTKSWPGFEFEKRADRRQARLNELSERVDRYLETPGSRLRLEFQFKSKMPSEIRSRLLELKGIYGRRLSWRSFR
jgi:hypothetical protein